MYATTSLRDAYRKFRAKDSSFLYAFGQQAFFVFVMGDALGKVSYLISERFDKGVSQMRFETVYEMAQGECVYVCRRELFLRPELTEADLRKLYPRVLKKLAEEGEWRSEGWRYAGALIKNPNFPSDLARASYGEPLLTELRIVYIFHHVHSRNLEKGELQKFEQESDGLRRECRDGKISLKKSNARRFKLTKKYLPQECPEDWVKSIP